MARIIFDEMHNDEVLLEGQDESGLTLLAERLRDKGHETVAVTGELHDSLEGAKVLSICYPKKPYSEEEKSAVRAFVEGGGRLFLAAEWGNLDSNAEHLNSLLEGLPVSFQFDRVIDRLDHFTEEVRIDDDTVGMKKIPQFIKIHRFNPEGHNFVHNVKEIYFFSGCSIDSPEANRVAWSSQGSFSDREGDSQWKEGEKVESKTVAAEFAVGEGHVFLIGDTSIFSNQYIDLADDMQFILNVFDWLTE